MEKKKYLYVSRSHFALWLMALCMTGSVIARSILFSGEDVWLAAVLPGAAAVLYALTVICSGEEMFYKSSIPVWLMGLSYGAQRGNWVVWSAAVILCGAYTVIAGGRFSRYWLLGVYLLALGGVLCTGRALADLLMIGGLIAVFPAVKVHTDEKWHPTWGDRIDGRRIRSSPAMEQIIAYFMPNRNGANNLFSESVEITQLEWYVRQKRREGLNGFGVTHVIMAAYVRTVAKYPALNRFIAGQKIYSRGEDIALCMTVKKEMNTNAPDSVVKVHLHPSDTAADVYRKFNAEVEKAKDEMEDTGTDKTAIAFMMIPGLLLKFTVWSLKTLDYFGLLPRFLLELSPFHGSVYFTSMGSLGIKPVYHHLYDFGTIPVFCAFGRKRRGQEIVGGEIVERKYMDLKFNLDERICDGFYYAAVIKYFLRILSHPEVLDTPAETVQRDIP